MKILHVFQQRIRKNIKATPEKREPPIIIRDGKEKNLYSRNKWSMQNSLCAR